MLQANEIQQRFTHLQQTLDEAQKACQTAQGAPAEVCNTIQKLVRESHQAESIIQSNDQSRIVEAVDKLEDLGDEVKRVSRSAPQIPAQLEAVCTRVHAELSDLKHKLH
jgi:septation ring formation regulator EzrA